MALPVADIPWSRRYFLKRAATVFIWGMAAAWVLPGMILAQTDPDPATTDHLRRLVDHDQSDLLGNLLVNRAEWRNMVMRLHESNVPASQHLAANAIELVSRFSPPSSGIDKFRDFEVQLFQITEDKVVTESAVRTLFIIALRGATDRNSAIRQAEKLYNEMVGKSEAGQDDRQPMVDRLRIDGKSVEGAKAQVVTRAAQFLLTPLRQADFPVQVAFYLKIASLSQGQRGPALDTSVDTSPSVAAAPKTPAPIPFDWDKFMLGLGLSFISLGSIVIIIWGVILGKEEILRRVKGILKFLKINSVLFLIGSLNLLQMPFDISSAPSPEPPAAHTYFLAQAG